MAQWLKAEKIITDNDYNTYFWLGIPKPFQTKLETYLLARNPSKDLSKPYTVKEVNTVVDQRLHQNRFDKPLQSARYKHKAVSLDSESDFEDNTDRSSEGTDYYPKSRREKVSSHAESQ